jgi:hypothetical protein
MENMVKAQDFVIDDNVYEIRITKQADGVEVQAYQKDKVVPHIASEFADWGNIGDLRTYQNIDAIGAVEDMVDGIKSHIIEYHKRCSTP